MDTKARSAQSFEMRGKVLWRTLFFKGTISLIFSFRAQEMHCECFDKKWLSFDLLCKRKIGLFIVCRYLWLVFPSTQWYTHNHPPMSILSIMPMFTTWGFAMSMRISEDWNLFVLLHVFRRPPIHRLAFQQQGLWIDWKVIFVRYYTYSHHLPLLAIIEWNVHFLIRWRLGKYCTYLQKNHKR